MKKKHERREIVSFNELAPDLPTLIELDETELELVTGGKEIAEGCDSYCGTYCDSYCGTFS